MVAPVTLCNVAALSAFQSGLPVTTHISTLRSSSSTPAMEHIDKIVYINLDSRPDLREQIEHALRSLRGSEDDGVVERFLAVAHS